MESRKLVFLQSGILLLGEAICVGAMCGVYALLHLLTLKVLIGGVVGALLSTLNFFIMSIFVMVASNKAIRTRIPGTLVSGIFSLFNSTSA